MIETNSEVIKELKIEQKLSEEKGKHSSTFYYRLEKELGAGIDENGDPCEAYCKYTIEHQNEIIDYDHFHQKVIRAEVAQRNPEFYPHVTPISKEEYEREMEERNK